MTEKVSPVSGDAILQAQRLPREIAVSHEIGWLLAFGVLWNDGSGARRPVWRPGATWLAHAAHIILPFCVAKGAQAVAWRRRGWQNQQDDAEQKPGEKQKDDKDHQVRAPSLAASFKGDTIKRFL